MKKMLKTEEITKKVNKFVPLREDEKLYSEIKYSPHGDIIYKVRNQEEEVKRSSMNLYLRMAIDPLNAKMEEFRVELLKMYIKELSSLLINGVHKDKCKIYDKYKFRFHLITFAGDSMRKRGEESESLNTITT